MIGAYKSTLISGAASDDLGELGFGLPQFPFIAHIRGWSAEDMEQNVAQVKGDQGLHDGAKSLTARCLELAAGLIACEARANIVRGGRKADGLK